MPDKNIEIITFNTRVAAVQCVYSVLFMGEKLTAKTMKYFRTKSFLSEEDEMENRDINVNAKLFAYIVKGIVKNQETLDKKIAKYLKIDLDKNDSLVISIIRAGAFELLFRDNTPSPIVISEYTKIANKFYPAKKTALVNAVLDKIAKEEK